MNYIEGFPSCKLSGLGGDSQAKGYNPTCAETGLSIMPPGLFWVSQVQVFSYRPPGAQRRSQEVQVTVEGEHALWGQHGSID